MFTRKGYARAGFFALGLMLAASAANAQSKFGIGKPASENEIKAWDIDVSPNGAGLPAGSGSVAQGGKLYAEKCAACHGADGKKPLMPDYPKIAGQNAKYVERQMLDIKSGARNNGQTAAMKGVMELVNDEEIKALSVYLSSLK